MSPINNNNKIPNKLSKKTANKKIIVKVCFTAQNSLPWWLFCCVFHATLRRICVMMLLDEIVYKCQLNPVDWWSCSSQLSSYPFHFALYINSWTKFKSSTIIHFPINSFHVYLLLSYMFWQTLFLGSDTFRIVLSSPRTNHFIIT